MAASFRSGGCRGEASGGRARGLRVSVAGCRWRPRCWSAWRCWPRIGSSTRPAYLAVWVLVGPRSGRWSQRRAWSRAPDATGSASASTTTPSRRSPLPLVRRTLRGYALRLAPVPGESRRARADAGREPDRRGAVDVPLPAGSRAELTLGTGTFVVRSVPIGDARPELPRGVVRRFARRAAADRARGAGQRAVRGAGRARRSGTPT